MPFVSRFTLYVSCFTLFALTALLVATAPATPRAHGYPRLGMWLPDTWHESITTMARYDFLVLGDWQAEFIPQLQTANPNQLRLVYQAVSEVWYDPDDPSADVLALPHQWFLTQVGSTLTAPINASQTQIAVANVVNADGSATFVVGDTVLIEGETMRVTGINATTKTLTVQRGYVRPASSHAAGTRIAAHITFWPQTWMMNVSTLAPRVVVSPTVGAENWAEYRARQGVQLVGSAAWDGILVDRGEATQSWLIGNSTARTIDPDNSNIIPLDNYAAFDRAWGDGVHAYHSRLRAALGSKPIFVNWGMSNYDLLNGNNFEAFPRDDGSSYSGDWHSTVFGPFDRGSYFDWMTRAQSPNLTMIETYEDDSGPDPDDGSYHNRCIEPGFAPNYRKMRFGLTTALLHDGYFSYEMNTNGHGSLCLMWFDEYDNAGAGRGYLGEPLGSATQAVGALTTPNVVTNGSFESGWSGWNFWADSANGYIATQALDTTTAKHGTTSARVDVTQTPGVDDWRVSLEFAPVSVISGTEYTISFWAKASRDFAIHVWVQQEGTPWIVYGYLTPGSIPTTWQHYELPFVTRGTDSAARLGFSIGAITGTIWLDDVKMQVGSREVWRRDFTHGIALVNATTSPQTLALGGTFQKIRGTQVPTINDGSLASQVTLAPRDGIVLLRPSPLMRAFLPLLAK